MFLTRNMEWEGGDLREERHAQKNTAHNFLTHTLLYPQFKRYVEIGRVALVKCGPLEGQLVVIVDVINMSKMLVDQPSKNFKRQVVHLRDTRVTDYKVEIGRMPDKSTLAGAAEDADYANLFASSAWGQKLAKRKAKAAMTDFQRYQKMASKGGKKK